MDELLKRFEDIKTLLLRQATPMLGEDLSKSMVSILEDYQRSLREVVSGEARRITSAKEENNLLRGLLGTSDAELTARIIAQGEELRYLRAQYADMKKQRDALAQQKDGVLLEKEKDRAEAAREFNRHEQEQRRYTENLAGLKKELEKLGAKMQEKQREMEAEREMERKQAVADRELAEKAARGEVEAELRAIITRLRNLCGAIVGTSQFCVERWGKIRAEYQASRTKLPAEDAAVLADSIPDLDLIFHSSQEVIMIIDSYLQILDQPKPSYAPLDWMKFWQELRARIAGPHARLPVKLMWPTHKEFPPFASDEKILAELCTVLVKHAVEAAEPGSAVSIDGQFLRDGVSLGFTYTGPKLSEEERKNLFVPFSDTKLGHRGLNLNKALRLARRLDGSIAYDEGKTGNVFTVSLPAPGESLQPL